MSSENENTINTNSKKENKDDYLNVEKKEEIKDIDKKSEFEEYIINAYLDIQNNLDKECEKNLEKAFIYLQKNKDSIIINKNIIFKLKRISQHEKIILLMLISKIYIILLYKDNLFSPQKYDDMLLITFINEAINLNEILKETSLNLKFERGCVYFFNKIIENFKLGEEQKEAIENIIIKNQQKYLKPTISIDTFENMVTSLYESLSNQESLFNQYKVILDNKENIIGCILNCDINKYDMRFYLDLGKLFSSYLFNEFFVIDCKKYKNIKITKRILYNGKENEEFLNIIDNSKYRIIIDEEINNCRKELISLVIVYVEKFRKIDDFKYLYLLHILMKKIYFYYYDILDEKTKEQFNIYLSEILVEICSYEKNVHSVEIGKQFMKYILKSQNEKDEKLKELIINNINLHKENSEYEFETNSSINKTSKYELLEINNNDIKIGSFNRKEILAGEIFSIYIDLEEGFNLFELTWSLEENDINFSVIDITNNEEIIKLNQVNYFNCPYKIIMFSINKGIYKINFDNSFSWINSKFIKFKYNIFYPEFPYTIVKKKAIIELKKLIENEENTTKNKEYIDQVFIVKFNQRTRAYNCDNLFNNIFKFQKLKNENKIFYHNLYIDNINEKFYNEEFKEFDLNKKNFENYLDKLNIENEKVNIINLLNITYKSVRVNNILEILHFVPDFRYYSKNKMDNLLYFSCNISLIKTLYDLYIESLNKEDTNIILHVNYIQNIGFQICIYKDGLIFYDKEKFNDFDKNVQMISNYVNSEKNGNIKIVISSCGIKEELIKKFGKEIEEKITENINYKIEIKEGKNYLSDVYNLMPIILIDD